MSLVAFSPEEQVEAFGETYTLRLDFRAISVIEGALETDFPTVIAHLRSGRPNFSLLSRVIWAVLRQYHSDVTIDQALAMVIENGEDSAKFGLALDALLSRALPIPKEDRKPANPPKRNGRLKSSAASG